MPLHETDAFVLRTYTIKEADKVCVFFTREAGKLRGVAHYLAELVIEFVPDHEPNERVYRLVNVTLESLRRIGEADATERNERLPAIVRYFEIWMLKLAGFFPYWKNCGACEKDLSGEAAVWLTNEGIPQCSACGGGRGEELRPFVWRTIHEILTQSPAIFLSSPRDARSIAQIGNLAARLINRVIERELKSYEVLDRLRPVEYR